MTTISVDAQRVKDQLFRLVKSLSKAEKRHFKLFAKRGGATSASKFIRLFDLLVRHEAVTDTFLSRKLLLTSAPQLASLKAHLYHQILSSLRLLHSSKEIDIELRELLDFARILYGKGHALDALRVLNRASDKAVEHSQDLLHLEILEFQKLIEARHITLSRQVSNKMEALLQEAERRCFTVLDTSGLFSLNIQLHGRYIEKGHARNDEQREANEAFWRSLRTQRSDRHTTPTTFNQKFNRHQAEMWHHYGQLDFTAALDAALNAYQLFNLERRMTVKDPDGYLRCLYYVTMLSYLEEDATLLDRHLRHLEAVVDGEDTQLNENSQRIGKTYLYLARYNSYFLRGELTASLAHAAQVRREFEKGDFTPINHRWGLFLYKEAAVHFLNADYDRALDPLNEIDTMRASLFRQDLLINARLLQAICTFELGQTELATYHLDGLARLLRQSREAADTHRHTVSALRRLLSHDPADHPALYDQLLRQLESLPADAFERKAATYLDVGVWVRLKLLA